MKRIAVYFDKPGFESYPFNKPEYRTAYHEIAALIHARGARFHIARGYETFLKNNRFSKGWEFDGEQFQECGPFETSLIYDKGYGFFDTDPATHVLNERELDILCTDKWKTFELFPQYSPKTYRVHSPEELQKVLADLGDEKAVAKPLDGEEGNGVIIGTAQEIGAKVTEFPYLIQAFIDTSGGIPGIVEGLHDYRIVSISGTPVYSYVRTPPKGEFLANVARGGSEIEVPVDHIPPDALALWNEVDAHFGKFPKRVYSVDMGRGKDEQWRIIELNAKPGLKPVSFGPEYARFQELLVDTFLS